MLWHFHPNCSQPKSGAHACVIWRIHALAVTHLEDAMCKHSSMCVTSRINMCNMAHSHVRHISSWLDLNHDFLSFLLFFVFFIDFLPVCHVATWYTWNHDESWLQCMMLQLAASHCNTLQHTTTHCNTMHFERVACGQGTTRFMYSRLQIGWHCISRLFLKLFQRTRILPMGFTIIAKQYMMNPMRILVRLVLNWKFLEIISRCCATLSAIGCMYARTHVETRWRGLQLTATHCNTMHFVRVACGQGTTRVMYVCMYVCMPGRM